MFSEAQKQLLKETQAFYTYVADQFSETRQDPWDGWKRLLSYLPSEPFSLVDVAAGNCRFERYLAEQGYAFEATAIDCCSELLEQAPHTNVVCANLFDASLLQLAPERADVVVSFGFMHHIPGTENRKVFLGELLDRVRPKGMLALSFWQFARDARIAQKACEVTERYLAENPQITLEEGDYLLGWRDMSEVFRFCHHFSDAEIEELAQLASQNLHKKVRVESYVEDGKAHNLNRYLLLFPE